MTFVDLVRTYQRATLPDGSTIPISLRAFARHLGVSATVLSNFYQGKRRHSPAILRAFLRTYPEAAADVARAMLAEVA